MLIGIALGAVVTLVLLRPRLVAASRLRHENAMLQRDLELDRERVSQQGALQQQLRLMQEGQERLRGETSSLVSALRQPHTRGRWGELQLRRVVELAGMTAYCDFTEQTVVQGDGRTLRPDM